MKSKVRVKYTGTVYVEIEVEHEGGDDPGNLTKDDRRAAWRLVPDINDQAWDWDWEAEEVTS